MKKILFLAVFALGMTATAQKLSLELTQALKNDDTLAIAALVTNANKDSCYEFKSGNLNILQLAVSMGSGDVLNQLITDYKVNTNTVCSGKTALMLAASQGKSTLVESLLNAGADRKVKLEGKTALDFATESKNDATIKLLKK
jgi:ankyrin repeat protein